jgi:urea transporter
MMEYLIRFFIGGFAVSAFAVLGDVLRPKSFAGLFGAAPSVALATLAIAFWNRGPGYAALEGRSMVIGSVALCLYSIAVCQLMKRYEVPALTATLVSLVAWTFVAFAGKWLLLVALCMSG